MAAFRDVMELGITVRDPARRDVIVRHAAHELGIGENAAWDYVRRNWAQRSAPRGRRRSARPAQPAAKLSAEQLLPAELLGLLLENPELVPEAAGQVDAQGLRDCPETRALERLLKEGARKGPLDVARFVGSLGELAGAAARAMAEEKARTERMAAADAPERFELYMHYLERKKKQVVAADATDWDDETIRELERRLKDLDRRSAESK